MDDNFDVLTYATNNINKQSILATIIKVEGSAYRKEGTMMLLKGNGETAGVLSVGCLEDDLVEQVKMMLELEEVKTKIIEYDLSAEDDLSWGRGAGCNGKITVLLEKLDDPYQNHLKKVIEFLNKGLRVMAIKEINDVSSNVVTRFEVENGESFGDQFELRNINLWNETYLRGNILLKNIYFHHFNPRNRLFIFGAGIDARPVASLAANLNFNVFVWDWRIENLQATYFPSATILSSSVDWKNIEVSKNDFIVMMTHDFQKDKQLLQHFLTYQKLKYIGILGPKKRTRRLLNGNEIPPQLHSPIGLPLGAEGPWEIAISMIAEIIACNRKSNVNLYEEEPFSKRENEENIYYKPEREHLISKKRFTSND